MPDQGYRPNFPTALIPGYTPNSVGTPPGASTGYPASSADDANDLHQRLDALRLSGGPSIASTSSPTRPFTGGFSAPQSTSLSEKPLPQVPPRKQSSIKPPLPPRPPHPYPPPPPPPISSYGSSAFPFPTPTPASPTSYYANTTAPYEQGGVPPLMLNIPSPTPPAFPLKQAYSNPPSPTKAPSHKRPSVSSTDLNGALQMPSPSSSPLNTPTKTKPDRQRASSVPPSPSAASAAASAAADGKIQCSGVTKANKRCGRMVSDSCALAAYNPDEPLERYCFQHRGELLHQTGFYTLTQPAVWIKFEDWIPENLQDETKVLLRVEMAKPISAADVPGYIYTYEIRDQNTPDQVHLKVGRAVNLVKRIDEWGKQCGSKEVVLRGYWPGGLDPDSTMVKGMVTAGSKGKHCHRLERLIHLELADLSLNAPYLNPSADSAKKAANTPPVASPKRTPKKPSAPAKKACPDCGAVHKEIFTFTKAKHGKLKGREWEGLVKLVVERWGKFIEESTI